MAKEMTRVREDRPPILSLEDPSLNPKRQTPGGEERTVAVCQDECKGDGRGKSEAEIEVLGDAGKMAKTEKAEDKGRIKAEEEKAGRGR